MGQPGGKQQAGVTPRRRENISAGSRLSQIDYVCVCACLDGCVPLLGISVRLHSGDPLVLLTTKGY